MLPYSILLLPEQENMRYDVVGWCWLVAAVQPRRFLRDILHITWRNTVSVVGCFLAPIFCGVFISLLFLLPVLLPAYIIAHKNTRLDSFLTYPSYAIRLQDDFYVCFLVSLLVSKVLQRFPLLCFLRFFTFSYGSFLLLRFWVFHKTFSEHETVFSAYEMYCYCT